MRAWGLIMVVFASTGVRVTQPDSGALGRVLLAGTPPTCLLAGDWRPPELLLLAHSPAWAVDLEPLVAAAAPTPLGLLSAQPHAARRWLAALEASHARVLDIPIDSRWVRDYGPLQQRCATSWRWRDADYAPHRPHDDALPRHLSAAAMPLHEALEGGALISNGSGLCVITWATWNAIGVDLRDADRLQRLIGEWGCEAIAVVPAPLQEPSGHIDLVAQFLRQDQIALAQPTAPSGWDTTVWESIESTVRFAAAQMGAPLEVVRVPAYRDAAGIDYSYVNAVALQHGLIVPSYAAVPDAVQDAAYAALRAAGHRLIIVPADGLIEDGGAWHCATLGLFTWPPRISTEMTAR